MIDIKLIFLLLFGTAILAWACKPSESPDAEAAAIVHALNTNSTEEAHHRVNHLFSTNGKLDAVDIPHLCALSIALARESQTDKHSDDFTAQALQCYRMAMQRDSVTATGYYSNLNQEEYQYYSMLLQLSAPVTARENGFVYTVNEMGEDVIVAPQDSSITK